MMMEEYFEDVDITPEEADEFLGFEKGTFDHIPHYARRHALGAIADVREMEKKHIFRPGLYYIVLADLCRATEAANVLGNKISKRRVETFILTCVETLGNIEIKNYQMFIREIGDAALFLFSSFDDVYLWWMTMNSWLSTRNSMWMAELELTKKEQMHFRLDCKTVIHAGEIDYSDKKIPLSNAINQTFKIEKQFKPSELGITEIALRCAKPLFRSLEIKPRYRNEVILPGDKHATNLYVADNYKNLLKRRRSRS